VGVFAGGDLVGYCMAGLTSAPWRDSLRHEAWQQIIAAAPRFAQYQQKTDRELPVIRLMPRPATH